MAKIRTIAPVGQIRGSIGGSTYSQNRYGVYIRARSIPTVVHTEATEKIRNAFTWATKAWRNLEPEVKSAWNLYAENNKVYDNFGEQQVLSGHGMYVKVNAMLQALTGNILELPPTKATPGAVPDYVMEVGNNDTEEISTVSIKFDVPWPTEMADYCCDIRIALVDSFGRRIQSNMWRFLCIATPSFTPTTIMLNNDMVNAGLTHIEGKVVWLRIRLFNFKEGTWGPWDTVEADTKVEYPINIVNP